jgi:hypothetical protein
MPKPKKFHRLLAILAVLATLPLARLLTRYMDGDLAKMLASQLADWLMVGLALLAARLKWKDNLKVAELFAQQIEDARPKTKSDLKGVQNHGG